MAELLLITEDELTRARFESLGSRYNFKIEALDHEEKLLELPQEILNYKVAVLDAPSHLSPVQMAERVQMTKQLAQCNYLVLLVEKKLSEEYTLHVKRQGVNFIFLKNQLNKFKLDFLIVQNINYLFTPIKAADLRPNTPLGFTICQLIPHRNKYLPFSSSAFSEAQINRFREKGLLYIERQDLKAYKDYLLRTQNSNYEELARATFLELSNSFNELVFLLIEDSSFPNFERGQELLKESQKLAKTTLKELLKLGTPSPILPQRTAFDLDLDRSIAIAAQAGLWSEELLLQTEDVMLAALFMDLGELLLPASTIYKLERGEKLYSDEQKDYEIHPLESVEMLLAKRLPLAEFVRDLIHQSHELANQKGFPKQLPEHKIWEGSELIRLAKEMDEATTIRPGMVRPELIRQQMDFLSIQLASDRYSPKLLEAMSKLFKQYQKKIA